LVFQIVKIHPKVHHTRQKHVIRLCLWLIHDVKSRCCPNSEKVKQSERKADIGIDWVTRILEELCTSFLALQDASLQINFEYQNTHSEYQIAKWQTHPQ